jgi:hypothetical protein
MGRSIPALGAALIVGLVAAPASGQTVGSFAWQLQPFCNRVTMLVVQTGGGFTLDGFDDRCGAAQRVPVRGLATLNPDGTVELGFTGIGETGLPVHVSARLSLPAASGTWRDSQGRGGAFALGAATGGPALPAPFSVVPPPPGVGENNTAVGSSALRSNTAGFDNSAFGAGALTRNTTGVFNTASGSQALVANTTGDQNTALGAWALKANATAVNNTAVGAQALSKTVGGGSNTAVGALAMVNTTAVGNTAVGSSALFANTTGLSNAALGIGALLFNVTGSSNVAVGPNALRDNVSGSGNIAIGWMSGRNLISGDENIYLQANAVLPDEFGTIRIGSTHPRAFIAGIRGRTTGVSDAIPVVIDSAGQLGTVSSSARTKDDVADLGDTSQRILQLRPVRFTYKQPFANGSRPVQYGLIAEEVADVLPELVARDADGEIETVKYHVLPTLLLAEIQRLERERQAQAARIDTLERQLQRLLSAVEPR